jgi:hypothetical protein
MAKEWGGSDRTWFRSDQAQEARIERAGERASERESETARTNGGDDEEDEEGV